MPLNTQYYFLMHILATAFSSLILIKVFWTNAPLLNSQNASPYELQVIISMLVSVIGLSVIAKILVRRKVQINFRPWMLQAGISGIYLFAIGSLLSVFYNFFISFGLGLIAAVGFYYATRDHLVILPIYTFFLTLSVVFSLVLFLPFWFVIITAIGYSIYDIYAVFRGPLGMLINSLKSQEKMDLLTYSGLATPIKGRMLGLGDSIFYSALFSTVYLNVNPFAGLLCLLGILAGFLVTFSLAKNRPMPALPISIGLGIALSILGAVV